LSLDDILKNRKCFKLVCGAGNEDAQEVERLISLYARAGARYFDLSAKESVVIAAKKALDRSVPKGDRKNFFLNVSVGIKGDPHVSKALIDRGLCTGCGACQPVCEIQKAIDKDGAVFSVDHVRCIGCGNCLKVCPANAITLVFENAPLSEVLPPLIDLGLDSIELHAVTEDEDGAYGQWTLLQKMFPGMLSLCLDRSCLGDVQLLARIKRFLEGRREFMTIIQADGAPMSGSDDKPGTTLQTLATAQIVSKARLPVYLMLSGGTNSKTSVLAKKFGIPAHGVAVGSYARKIVRAYIDRDDFLTNKKVFQTALVLARALVDKTLRFMGA
jgi:ferredoxin